MQLLQIQCASILNVVDVASPYFSVEMHISTIEICYFALLRCSFKRPVYSTDGVFCNDLLV